MYRTTTKFIISCGQHMVAAQNRSNIVFLQFQVYYPLFSPSPRKSVPTASKLIVACILLSPKLIIADQHQERRQSAVETKDRITFLILCSQRCCLFRCCCCCCLSRDFLPRFLRTAFGGTDQRADTQRGRKPSRAQRSPKEGSIRRGRRWGQKGGRV